MKSIFRFLSAIAVAVLMSACAATGATFSDVAQPNSDQALVYVYRPSAFTGGCCAVHIKVDGQQFADLHSGGYSYAYLSPGRHMMKQEFPAINPTEGLQLPLTLEGARTYFVAYRVAGGLSIVGMRISSGLGEVPPDMARTEIAECKLEPSDPQVSSARYSGN